MNPKTLCDQNTKEQLAERVVGLETELKIEKRKHLDTSNWAMEQQERAELLEAVVEAAEELQEVAYHRGDNILPLPEDDPLLWTARMQTAWDELEKALASKETTDENPPK